MNNKGFIHTFSLETKISEEEAKVLEATYKDIGGYFYNGKKKIGVLCLYAQEGVRMEIEDCHPKAQQYDGEHKKNKVFIIVNLYKLLNPGKKYGAVQERAELKAAFEKLVFIINEIYEQTGIDLFHETKIERVDVTYDVVTPGEEYTKEIIGVAKKTELQRGYYHWDPSEAEIHNDDWKDENAMFMYNHNQELAGKIYNKKQDPEIQDHLPEELKDKGLLRFEVTLKRGFLKRKGYYNKDGFDITQFFPLLVRVTENAEVLIYEYMCDKLDNGAMLSKMVLCKYIRGKCKSKSAKAEKMLNYVNYANGLSYDKSIRITPKVKNYFVEMGISPKYTERQCPYIPSFTDLLLGQVDEKMLWFAKGCTKNSTKVQRYWE